MRLAEHSLYCYRLRYERPVRWSDIVEEAAPFVLLRLQSDNGAVGVAEVTVKPTWCGVSARSLIAALEDVLLPLVATVDLDDPTKVRAMLDRIPENQAAKTLIDNACWDLHAASLGGSVWRLWGGAANRVELRIEVSWALTRQAPLAMAAEAAAMVARHGFRVLKVKGGQGFDLDRAGMRAIRSAVGEGVRLYVDANGFYSMQESKSYVKAMADNAAFKQAQYNQEFVLTEYFAYLRRDPEPDGYNFWLNVLNNSGVGNPGAYRGMVCSFVTSAEYQKRFSSIVSHSNGECE